MQEAGTDLFGADMQFPAPLAEEIPENLPALRSITAGQRAVGLLYASLADEARGESGFVVRLLRRDWENRFDAIVRSADELLRALGGGKEKEPETLPPPEKIRELGRRWSSSPARQLLGAISAFVSRTLISSGMVPWVSDSQEVFEHFNACLEAEDAHGELLDLLTGLVD